MFSFLDRSARTRGRSSHRRRRFEQLEERIVMSGVPPTVTDVAVSSSEWSQAYLAFVDPGEDSIGGYRIPTGSSAQTTALPWKNLDQIKVRFDKDVDVQAADLSLTGKNVTSYAFEHFEYNPQTRTATWHLTTPIAKDKLLIDLDANGIDPVADLEGNILDGEWSNNSSSAASGNGVAGGDFEFLINVLPGEVNNMVGVNSLDYLAVRAQDGKSTNSTGYNFKYDIDGSGAINTTDWTFTQSKMGNSLPTGSPAGIGNDAPTARAIHGRNISDPSVAINVSLWDAFGDVESGATGLSYSVLSNSSPGLFNSLLIDASTGQLVVVANSNVSGRANISIVATDTGGIATTMTIPINVNYANQAPLITSQHATYQGSNIWRFHGVVVDSDDDVTGLIVTLAGMFDARVIVYPNGTFQFDYFINNFDLDEEIAFTEDRFGELSNVVLFSPGL